jgi:hypothetical protein
MRARKEREERDREIDRERELITLFEQNKTETAVERGREKVEHF